MGDLTGFGRLAFWLFWMASLCIQTYHVIVYYRNLLLHNFGYCTLTQYKLVLCSNAVSFGVNFACLISNFVSLIVLSLGLNFHIVSNPLYIDFSPSQFLLQVRHHWLGAHSADWSAQVVSYGPISEDHLDSIQFIWVEIWDGDIFER